MLWLNIAGGIIAAVIGFIVTGQVMQGQVFSKTSSSRNVAKLFMFSGMLVISGGIAALVQLLVIAVLQPHVFTIDFFVGWGAFAELVIGLILSIVGFKILGNIPKKKTSIHLSPCSGSSSHWKCELLKSYSHQCRFRKEMTNCNNINMLTSKAI
jgi:uncharacterized protein YacL